MKHIADKKLLMAVIACGMCVIILSGGICGYYIVNEEIINAVTVGQNVTAIEEDYEPPASMQSGQVYTKEVTVRNVKGSDCYVRVFAEASDPYMASGITLDINTDDWTAKQADGYYYYKNKLRAGQATEPLFTQVKALKDLSEFQLIIYSESVQAYGSSSPQEAFRSLN